MMLLWQAACLRQLNHMCKGLLSLLLSHSALIKRMLQSMSGTN